MEELLIKRDVFRHLYGIFLAIGLFSLALQPAIADPAPKLALAKVYDFSERPSDEIEQYWVSEKLDGVRAYWDGKKLISRQGNSYNAPNWFTKGFPAQPLDGELWIKRSTFEQLVSTVRKDKPIDSEWKQVKYMIFDLPASSSSFTDRLTELHQLLDDHDNPYLQLIKQYRLTDHDELQEKLKSVIKLGGEGLMLHRGDSSYKVGRTSDILKVKTYQDAEAIVIAHLPGKGKYEGMLGAILVELPDGKRFKIGTGFKDKDRKNPPVIGSEITYKYFGLTRKGIPKFASFLRIRKPYQ